MMDHAFADILSLVLICSLLLVGMFIFLFMERFVSARVEHRDGPGRHGGIDAFQVIKDFVKINKRTSHGGSMSVWYRAGFFLWAMLAALFFCVLLARLPAEIEGAGIFLLFLFLVFSLVLEAVVSAAAFSGMEEYNLKRQIPVRVLGILAFVLSFLPVILGSGSGALTDISLMQQKMPYWNIISSPGLFVSGIVCFFSIYLVVFWGAIYEENESLSGSWQYVFFFVRRMWIFSLVSMWAFAFLGGEGDWLSKVTLAPKVLLALFAFFLIKTSLPKIRVADAEMMAVRWLLPAGAIGFLLQILWMGVTK